MTPSGDTLRTTLLPLSQTRNPPRGSPSSPNGPFRNAQVRELDRPCQRCSDAVWAVRPYNDKARAS
jgi:hypothetical protein